MVITPSSSEAQLAAIRAAPPKENAKPSPSPPSAPTGVARPSAARRASSCSREHDLHYSGLRPADDACRRRLSLRLDIVPAEFLVHRHINGKWTCRCCQRQGIERLLQEPADRQIIDGGIPASGPVAQKLTSRWSITCRTTVRRSSMPVPACTRRVRHRHSEPAKPAQRCCRCTRCTNASCWPARSCMPMRRRRRCWGPFLAKPRGLLSRNKTFHIAKRH